MFHGLFALGVWRAVVARFLYEKQIVSRREWPLSIDAEIKDVAWEALNNS